LRNLRAQLLRSGADYEVREAVCRKAHQKFQKYCSLVEMFLKKLCGKVDVNNDDHTETDNNTKKKTQPQEHESLIGYNHAISRFEKLAPRLSKNAHFL
jgi:hypothetical protein